MKAQSEWSDTVVVNSDSVSEQQEWVDSLFMGVDSVRIDTLQVDSLQGLSSLPVLEVNDSILIDTIQVEPVPVDTIPVKSTQVKEPVKVKPVISPSRIVYYAYMDSLEQTRNSYFGSSNLPGMNLAPEKYIELSPLYYKLFIPLTYYYAPIRQAFRSHWRPQQLKPISYPVDTLFPVDYASFDKIKRADRKVNRVLLDAYLVFPGKVAATEERISKRRTFKKEVVKDLPPKVNVVELFQPELQDTRVKKADYHIHKPNFWVTKGNGSLQFTQNYISENWHKGGESTNSLLSQLQLEANYDDKQRLELDNKLEVKLGFVTAPSDTVHNYKPNQDLIRLTSKLGVKAIEKWYYTLSAEFNTQFFSNYKTNTNDKQSAFLSPANLIVSLGMDYKQNKKKYNLSVFLSPLTYSFRYVGSDEVNPTAFGLKEGEKTLNVFGSQLQSNLKWTIISSIVWESRFSYFTNYEKVEAEWENTINFVLNRYLSTKLFVHARYDDGVKRKNDNSYFQLKELLSFGINYTW